MNHNTNMNMNEYELTQKEHSNMKRALTGSQNRLKAATTKTEVAARASHVVQEVGRAMAVFEAKGYPDDWSRWERARDDAQLSQRLGRVV
jgi:hypothetical protein